MLTTHFSRSQTPGIRRHFNHVLFGLTLISLALAHGLAPQSIQAQDSCALPTGLTPASKCLDGSRNLVVGPTGLANCTKVYFDQDFTGDRALKNITVETDGQLYMPDAKRKADVERISVGGLFQVGTQACPIGTDDPSHQVIFNFLGERPCTSPQKCDGFNKGIEVEEKGRLRLYGLKGVPASDIHEVNQTGISWTHLSSAAGPEDKYGETSGALVPVAPGGSKSITVEQDVTQGPGAWQKGDWIAIATTGFSAVETEIVKIAEVSSNGTGGAVIQLEQALQHYHFGSPNPGDPSLDNFNQCSGFNYSVDERAEVGLLSRNIKLTAQIAPGANNLHWGGELHLHKGFTEASIQGVEMENFGKDQLGGYPLHFHKAGDVSPQKPRVNANSIHHSFNKCITIHSTSNVTVENNVCVRTVGHMFYEEIGDEVGIRFLKNLGLGAMSHMFDVTGADRDNRIKNLWWAGDHLGQKSSPDYNGYDGFNIPNTDAQNNPVRGVCATASPTGLVIGLNPYTPEHKDTTKSDTCTQDEIYFEPASGFWIIHPGTELVGNSIGGCQDVGRGYWYVPPQNRPEAGIPPNLLTLSLQPVGLFKNNRVHGCYSGLYAEREFGVLSAQLFPRVSGAETGKSLVATFDGLTSTRNRDRGVWLRPMWNIIDNGRFATNRNSVTLVSSGGLDGNAPGVWAMLEDSVVVGVSQNNVDRWGPCPKNAPDLYDCVEPTHPAMSAPNSAKGFPSPYYNLSGYMIYDGPVLIFRDRFVNFNVDVTPHLTKDDKTFLASYTNFPNANNPNTYEGDAALGWFQNNQSAYPTGTVSKQLSWDNVDLRHQIYTEKVNLGDFQDGDRNTAIIDLDGTLTGYHVVDSEGNPVEGADPISLNNLEFNHASNSVDECLSEGAQDTLAEGRPTSLISAGHYATLEFQVPFPSPLPRDPAKQLMTFVKDQLEFGEHPEMHLTSRNGLGVWEPKVASGYGYTVGASLCTRKPECKDATGIPARVSVGITDAIKPGISEADPFFVRVGVCFTNKDGSHPTNNFTITRGYRSWGGNGTNTGDTELRKYFNILINRYMGEQCHILDFQNKANFDPVKGCPGTGVSSIPDGGCKPPSVQGVDQQSNPACIFPKSTLSMAANIGELTLPDGSPDLTKYFYDAAKGLLFFNVVQDIPNASGPSPLGSCTGESDDPNCPKKVRGMNFYACPPGGCIDYKVELNDPTYDPGASNCEPYPTYAQDYPAGELKLAYLGGKTEVEQVEAGGKDNNFPHFEPKVAPACPTSVVEGAEEGEGGLPGLEFISSEEDDDTIAPPSCPTIVAGETQEGGCSLHAATHQYKFSHLIFLLPLLAFAWIRRNHRTFSF